MNKIAKNSVYILILLVVAGSCFLLFKRNSEEEISSECSGKDVCEIPKYSESFEEETGTNEEKEIMCGGIQGLMCPEGQTCKMEGNYPDASGVCVQE
ncbi:MAG: hypothetical protein OEV93_02710 [Candidatus Moranbacteria bacterium]|nr:hypothetical protein [Candidatus Moranbacteria bacterium]